MCYLRNRPSTLSFIVLVTESCPTLFATPWTIAHQDPLSMELQGKIPEWIAISLSRACFQTKDQTHMSCIGRQIPYDPPGSQAHYI